MQEIVDLMVEHRNMTRKSAEDFVKQLLSTIEDALLEGDSVKIMFRHLQTSMERAT